VPDWLIAMPMKNTRKLRTRNERNVSPVATRKRLTGLHRAP
jgi:hypothetical protein